jgi:ATP:corrinoid adenosyltransferase
MSGVALQTEFQLLNARLSQKADLLELAEEQIWRMWALWQNSTFDGVIDYPDSFNIHDKENTILLLKQAKETKPENMALLRQIDIMLAETLIKDEDILEQVKQDQQDPVSVPAGGQSGEMTHPPMTSVADLVSHMREMVEQGYTNEQIIELHPEMAQFFNTNGGNDNDA